MRSLLLSALWVHFAASASLVGVFFMLVLAGPSDRPTARRWVETVLAWSRALVLVSLASGVVVLLARTALFEGRPGAALEPRAVLHALFDTRPGFIWLTRHSLLIVLGAFLAIPANVGETRNWIAARGEALVLGMLALALMSGSSHAAAVTPGTVGSVAADVAHLVGIGVWMGGLVPVALLLRAASRGAGADARPYAVLAVRRFSRAALVAMIVLVASGVMNALAQVESMAGLLGTTHGHLLLAKLGVLVPIFALALMNRARLLPTLSSATAALGPSVMRRLATFVGMEAGLAFIVVGLAAAMTLTTPARHAQPVWPLPFRFSLDGVLDVATRGRALVASQLVVLGVVALMASLLTRGRRAPGLAAAVVLVSLAAGLGLPPIVVDAYPTTYRRPPVTYQAASIAPGASVYREHCAACHGASGAGDGTLAAAPVDLRSPLISRRHAGELFWLVTHGIPPRGMPGFEARLDEAQRWNVINFIRALGAAKDSGSIGGKVDAERPWLVAPDFAVVVGPLAPGALRDYRGRRMVLLVLYTLPGSRPRMTQLAQSYDMFWITGVELIAVPTDGSPDAIRRLGSSPPVLFPVVTDGASDIVETYRMFVPGPHAEVLIDRQGYIRAMWRGDIGALPDTTALLGQIQQLNEERNVPPFPDDHIH